MVTGKEICYSDKDWHGFSVFDGTKIRVFFDTTKTFRQILLSWTKKASRPSQKYKKRPILEDQFAFLYKWLLRYPG